MGRHLYDLTETETIENDELFLLSPPDKDGKNKKVKWDTVKKLLTGIMVDLFYPVGSIYITTNETNPGITLGKGTWETYAAGRFLVGADANDSDFQKAGKTGGAKEIDLKHKHLQTVGVDSRSMYMDSTKKDVGDATSGKNGSAVVPNTDHVQWNLPTSTNGSARYNYTSDSMENKSILPPYVVCYIWTRTA